MILSITLLTAVVIHELELDYMLILVYRIVSDGIWCQAILLHFIKLFDAVVELSISDETTKNRVTYEDIGFGWFICNGVVDF